MSEQEKAVGINREKFEKAQREALSKFDTGEIVIEDGQVSPEALIVGINPQVLPNEDMDIFARIEQGMITLTEFRDWRNSVDKAVRGEAVDKGLDGEWKIREPHPSYDPIEYSRFFSRHPRQRLVGYLSWKGFITGVLRESR